MKRSIIFIACLLMSCTGFSQGLTPRIHQAGKDTLFCFSLPQSRILAAHIAYSQACDSLRQEAEAELSLLQQSTRQKDSINLLLNEEQKNFRQVMQNQDKAMQDLQAQLKRTMRKDQNQVWQTRLCALAALSLGLVLLIRH
jgi:hypothetical protein